MPRYFVTFLGDRIGYNLDNSLEPCNVASLEYLYLWGNLDMSVGFLTSLAVF